MNPEFRTPAIPAAAATLLLSVLALTLLPLVPMSQTASAELSPVQVQEKQKLLSEGSGEIKKASDELPASTYKGNISLTIPRLGLKDVAVPAGETQAELDREGIIRFGDTGVPWQEGSNTFIVGHALGYPQTRVPYAFRDLDKMRPGDEILVKNEAGDKYTFRVYDYMTVRPADYWVTYPVEGKTIVSLQTCTPVPTFENRLIVRAELVS